MLVVKDRKILTSVVAETVELLSNSSYGYHVMYRSLHSVTKYMNAEKTQAAINKKNSRDWGISTIKFTT